MKIVLIILGAFVALAGLILIVAQPIVGILFALLGIGFVVYGIKYKKPEPKVEPEPVQASTGSETPQRVVGYDDRRTIMVSGFDYHQKELQSLLTEPNSLYDKNKNEWINELMLDYDERVFQYETATCPLHLETEPDNEYDPHAVRVLAGDVFIGYIPRGSFSEISNYASIEGVKTYVEIFGGKYKYLEHDDEADYLDTYEDKYYRIATDSTPVKARMVFEW